MVQAVQSKSSEFSVLQIFKTGYCIDDLLQVNASFWVWVKLQSLL